MREVSMEYHNCRNNGSSPWTTELVKLQQVQRILYQQNNYISFCEEYAFKKPRHSTYKNGVESKNNKYPWTNITMSPSKTGLFNFLAKRGLDSKNSCNLDDSAMFSLDWLNGCNIKTFPAEKSLYDTYEQCRLFEKNFDFASEMEMNGE